jgi:hypothetical protein
MRKIQNNQMQLGEIDITDIDLDLKSRDEIPQLLRGIQAVYADKTARQKIFAILRQVIPQEVSATNGRPGMHLWRLFVLATLRLNGNLDYDKVQELANNHRTLRQMLGHGLTDDGVYYSLQAIKDNFHLLTPTLLNDLNAIIVAVGHQAVGHHPEAALTGKGDSFVLETDVHYPTDINLLLDAINKTIILTARVCEQQGWSEWRQYHYNLRQIKKLSRQVQQLKRTTAKAETRRAQRETRLKAAYNDYLELAATFLNKAETVLNRLEAVTEDRLRQQVATIHGFISDGRRQIDQIQRRIFQGESIPHAEKIFSLFERHTEWISKGKAGVSQELGLRVALIADQYGFILTHQVLKKQTDDKVAVALVEQTQLLFPTFAGCSFDKGFYTPKNRQTLLQRLKQLVLPKKGKLSPADQALENDPAWRAMRQQHSAIESTINAMENHGLDRCLDHGEAGFERYVALAKVARNLQIMGSYLMQKERQSQKRRRCYQATYQRNRALCQLA